MNVELIDDNFNFDDLTLMPPKGVQGGAYFSRLKYKGEKLIIQTQKCNTKNGIKRTGKKSYCDLMFNNEDSDFSLWAEQFEDKIKELIYNNKDSWFHDDLEKEDIEYNWNSSLRSYKKKNYLFRTFIEKSKVSNNTPKIQIFNEDQERLNVEDITSNSNMICIIEIKGLKFTSQSFHLECMLMQIMLINDSLVENECLIKINNKKTLEKNPSKINNLNIENITSMKETNKNIESLKKEDGDDILEEKNMKFNEEEHDEEDENLEQGVELEDENLEQGVELKDENLEQGVELEDENLEQGVELKDEKIIQKVDDLEENLEKKSDEMLEINLELPKDLEINTLKLKKPNEVYINMYEQTLKKAKLAKRLAIEAYLEAKEIKRTYMLDLDEYLDDDLEKIINSLPTNELVEN